MLALAELQSSFGEASLGGDTITLAPAIIGDGLQAEQRLSIHRNNTTVLLCEVLGTTYPVVKKLVGEAFFDSVARAYVRAHPPRSPCLFEYGGHFGDYLANVPAVAELPYLSDVAKLEWAWNESFYAVDAEPLSASALAKIDPETYGDLIFTLHPSLRLVASAYPIKEIWDVNQCGADPDARVDLNEGAQRLAVLRAQTSVTFIELSRGGFEMTAQLSAGKRLEDAFLSGQRLMADFDPTATLSVLIRAGAFHTFFI
ncbi:HvfC/BufC N-terminal domain-containing protein [Magnetovibrio blakemorei]|uniref:Putative DNA-binding domain-containing protein n=1 Tax=Magnetovibrio blakemorei TaxID=28181 RepID=A0A1E5QB91_9PROT|nr:DNA-binding domain-containing protein [Magnetovibrio blakemorei]OEJ69237.1 hypothetical protein BEN30_03900 [Magnetovibrio blakemorei]